MTNGGNDRKILIYPYGVPHLSSNSPCDLQHDILLPENSIVNQKWPAIDVQANSEKN